MSPLVTPGVRGGEPRLAGPEAGLEAGQSPGGVSSVGGTQTWSRRRGPQGTEGESPRIPRRGLRGSAPGSALHLDWPVERTLQAGMVWAQGRASPGPTPCDPPPTRARNTNSPKPQRACFSEGKTWTWGYLLAEAPPEGPAQNTWPTCRPGCAQLVHPLPRGPTSALAPYPHPVSPPVSSPRSPAHSS